MVVAMRQRSIQVLIGGLWLFVLLLVPSIVPLVHPSGSSPQEQLVSTRVQGGSFFDEIECETRGDNLTEGDPFGGSWLQCTDTDFSMGNASNITIEGSGPGARLVLDRYEVNNWSEKSPVTKPDARSHHDMVYSTLERRIILFGGYDGKNMDDTWVYDPSGDTWTEKSPPESPTARREHSMAYWSPGNRVVLFGGTSGTTETWLYDPENDTWEERTPADHPSRRRGHDMVYHSGLDLLVLFGGAWGGARYNDTWVYDVSNDTWTDISLVHGPSRRAWHSMTYDGNTKKIILFGGCWSINSPHNDTWEYDLKTNTWNEIETTSPPTGRYDHSMVYAPLDEEVILFGGKAAGENFNDTWSYDTSGREWTKGDPGEFPQARSAHGAVYDRRYDRVVLFGGKDDDYYDDTWVHTLTDFRGMGTYSPPVVTIPAGMRWDVLTIDKREPFQTGILVSLLDGDSDLPIAGFENVTAGTIDLSGLNAGNISEIRLKVEFRSYGAFSPSLLSLGVEWVAAGSWRDSFTGESKLAVPLETDGQSIGRWGFDEGGGDWTRDSTGNGYAGMMYGPRWTDGRTGDALAFDGKNDYVKIQNSKYIPINDTLAISAWVKLHDNVSNGAILSKTSASGHFIDGGFGLRFVTENRILLYKGDGITSGNGAYGYWDGIMSTSSLNIYEWYYIVAVFDGTKQQDNLQLYVNGVLDASETGSSLSIKCDDHSLVVGASDQGTKDRFRGCIDEVFITRKIPGSGEVLRDFEKAVCIGNGNAGLARYEKNTEGRWYFPGSTISSRIIDLPHNHIWTAAHVSCNVSYTEELIIYIMDSEAHEVLFEDNYKTFEKDFDLTSLDRNRYASLYFKAYLESSPVSSPLILHWGLNWTELTAPVLAREITGNISISRKMPQLALLDLASHFFDPYSNRGDSEYGLEYVSDPANITMELDGSILNVWNISDNYSGRVDVVANCTNMYGLSTSSNMFGIVVGKMFQPPVWYSPVPDVVMDEDATHLSEYPLDDYIEWSSDGDLAFSLNSTDPDIFPVTDEENRIFVNASCNYSGNANVTVTAAWKVSGLSSDTVFNITVLPVNDPPRVSLVSPVNGTKFNSSVVELRWTAFDVDDVMENITYDLYLGANAEPELLKKGIAGENITVTDLADMRTYRWYVVPGDGKNTGNCTSGTWSFVINVTVENSLDLSSNVSAITITAGDEKKIGITLTNRGKTVLPVDLEVTGRLSTYTDLSAWVSVPAGGNITTGAKILVPGEVGPGSYDLVIQAGYEGGMEELKIPVTVLSGESGERNTEKRSDWYVFAAPIVIIAVVLLILLIVLIFVISRRRKKKGKEGEKESEKESEKEGGKVGEETETDDAGGRVEESSTDVPYSEIVHKPVVGAKKITYDEPLSVPRSASIPGTVSYYTPDEEDVPVIDIPTYDVPYETEEFAPLSRYGYQPMKGRTEDEWWKEEGE